MKKKDVTVREHLSTIQSEGGKARWANLSPEERSEQARKAVEARWAKKRAAEESTALAGAEAAPKPKKSPKKKPGK